MDDFFVGGDFGSRIGEGTKVKSSRLLVFL
jgi:hypothetical protein